MTVPYVDEQGADKASTSIDVAPQFVDVASLSLGELPSFDDTVEGRLDALRTAVKLADDVFSATGLAQKRVIDPLALAASFQSTVMFDYINPEGREKDDIDWVAAIILREANGFPQIVVARDDGLKRRRFSLAHEIAHILIAPSNRLVMDTRQPHARPRDDMAYFRQNKKEYFADLFAHMFPMPRIVFDRLVGAGLSDGQISALMKVSSTSVGYRRLYSQLLAGQAVA